MKNLWIVPLKHPFYNPLFEHICRPSSCVRPPHLEMFMSIFDVQKKAYLRNFRHVQRCAHVITCLIWWSLGYIYICIYILFLDQKYMWLMKNEKYIKALSDQQCSESTHEKNCFYIIQLWVNGTRAYTRAVFTALGSSLT